MINISEYLTTQTPLPPFLPYPRFLLELDLSQTAKMTYVLLLDRATLSQKNLWIDERGFVFVIFTICSLAEQLGRSTVSVSSALKELDAAGLIERRRTRFSSPNHIFVKIPNVELMKNQEYSAAEEYLEKITEQQTDRLFLVNTHHPILDALFNTKAAEATQKKISIDFEVNDLSNLPFDVSDMVVLLSNLLDNAIEACQQYDKGDKAIHVMAVAQQDFFISVRNTSEPVVIISGSIPTTKPEPQMHGFGLANIRLILEKYSGEYTMFYENGWFQFTADIPFTPIS